MTCPGCSMGDRPQCCGDGAVPCKVAVIGEAPGEVEVRSGLPFVGAAGRELDRLLALAGLERSAIYVDNTVGCRPKAKKGNVKPARSCIEACASRLAEDMKAADPDIVILLGATPVGALADGLSLKANHGLVFHRVLWGRERKIVTMYHPAAVLHNPSLRGTVESDWKRLPERLGQKRAAFVKHPRRRAKGVAVTGDRVSIDTETEFLGALTAPLVGISVMNGKEVLWTNDVAISGHPLICMWNAKYDLQVLRRHGLDLTRRKIADGMIAAYLLGEQSLGLKPMTLRQLGYEMDSLEKMLAEANAILLVDHLRKGFDVLLTKQQFDSLEACMAADDPGMALRRRPKLRALIGDAPEADVRDLAKMFPERLMNYACDDADATYQHWPLLEARLKATGLETLFWDVEMPLVPVLADMERRGLAINRQAAKALHDEWDLKIAALEDKLLKSSGLESPGSPQQVSALVYGKLGVTPFAWTAKDQPSTEAWVLERIAEGQPVVRDILEWRKYMKLNKTYLDKWLRTEGRVHPDFNQVRQQGKTGEDAEGATATGRMSSSGKESGNFQNIPKRTEDGKRVRSCVVAETGDVLLSVDYCLALGTRVLKADLTWVPIETLKVGDKLVGVDETTPVGRGKRRKTKAAIVERVSKQIHDCYELILEDGRHVVASANHKWLMSPTNSKPIWRETYRLKPGQYLRHFVHPWDVEQTQEAGYLAGFFDGEGYLTSAGYVVGYAQNVGATNDKVKELLRARNFTYSEDQRGKLALVRLTGAENCIRFLGSIRPERLLRKYIGKPDLGELPHKILKVRIVDVKHVGPREVISLQTSTRTYIAEGLVSHNCQLEWVLLGILSGCKKIIDAYVKGYDIHAYSTEKMGLLPSQRDTGKRVTYLWVYGGGAGKIAQILGVPRAQGQRFIDGLVAAYPEVAEWREAEIQKCLRLGYTETMLGRRRYVPELAAAQNEYEYKEASKWAYNMPPQGTAADIIKIATSSVDRFLKAEGLDNATNHGLVACVHDETVTELPKKALTKKTVNAIMESMIAAGDFLPIPLQVDAKYGEAWGKMIAWKEA